MPFFKHLVYPLGVFGFMVLTYLVIVGTSNAVNLTDGAGWPGHHAHGDGGRRAGHLCLCRRPMPCSPNTCGIPYIPGAGELAVFCGAMAGAGLGFLWFNAYPAEVFMGDVGALALGAALGMVAVIVRQEIVLFIMGGVFVAETLSVMLQVELLQATPSGEERRIFLMAPLHHHFEQKGLEGNAGGRALLDHHHDAGAVWTVDLETAMKKHSHRGHGAHREVFSESSVISAAKRYET